MFFKMLNFKLFLITSLITIITALSAKQNKSSSLLSAYHNDRNTIILNEEFLATGGNVKLTRKELKVNHKFLEQKYKELNEGIQYSDKNPAGMHFFKAKHLIDQSKVFKILQKMPKGALLHAYATAIVPSRWVVRNIFYMDGLMRCENRDHLNILTFRNHPERHNCGTQYVYINQERKNAKSRRRYDHTLETFINLYENEPAVAFDSTNTVYTIFENMITTLTDALLYIEAYRKYYRQMLVELYNNNIMYAEVRVNFNQLYDLNGEIYSIEQSFEELIDIVEDFKRKNSGFLGIKIIYSVYRSADPSIVRKHFEAFEILSLRYPQYVIGFDLVGYEDKGNPLLSFAKYLVNKSNSTNFFFHAGETNLYGSSTDLNLVDAVLLKTKRIGHGFALMKHPILLNAVKNRNIAVEVCPISNQIFHLVSDLRNHPATFFISQNIPMVIGSDSPGFWNGNALNYDFYYAIMSLAPNYAGLKVLKQLVWNSITYSMLSDIEKNRAYDMLIQKWQYFLDEILLE